MVNFTSFIEKRRKIAERNLAKANAEMEGLVVIDQLFRAAIDMVDPEDLNIHAYFLHGVHFTFTVKNQDWTRNPVVPMEKVNAMLASLPPDGRGFLYRDSFVSWRREVSDEAAEKATELLPTAPFMLRSSVKAGAGDLRRRKGSPRHPMETLLCWYHTLENGQTVRVEVCIGIGYVQRVPGRTEFVKTGGGSPSAKVREAQLQQIFFWSANDNPDLMQVFVEDAHLPTIILEVVE